MRLICMKTLTHLPLLVAFIPLTLPAYEKSMEQTPKGTIEVKTIPALTALEATAEGSYFDADNKMFRKLFRYISDKEIAMTTPVTVDVDPGAMRFLVGKSDLEKANADTENVKIINVPEQTVVSIGYNGRYSKENYDKHLLKLQTWLAENASEWEAAGEPVAVYWDGPFKLAAWKQAEVMIPIRKIGEDSSSE
jgi:effector-binding domain-containing protein